MALPAQMGLENSHLVGGLEQQLADKDQEVTCHLAKIRSLEAEIETTKSLVESSEQAAQQTLEEKEAMAKELAHSLSKQREEEVRHRRLQWSGKLLRIL